MTRRERHIAILQRIGHPYGAIGYEVGTDSEIEDLVRGRLWWRGLSRHNARVIASWIEPPGRDLLYGGAGVIDDG